MDEPREVAAPAQPVVRPLEQPEYLERRKARIRMHPLLGWILRKVSHLFGKEEARGQPTTLTLHRRLLEEIQRHLDPMQMLIDLVIKRLEEQGTQLSERQRRRIAAEIRKKGDFKLNIGWSWKWWEKSKPVTIKLTESDGQAIEARMQQLIDKLPEILGKLVPELVETTMPEIWAAIRPGYLVDVRKDEREFRKMADAITAEWRKPFQTLSLLIEVAYRVPFSIDEFYEGRKMDEPHLVDVLTRLNTRGVHTAREVLTLLRAGYPDGAMARWRTLHEIAVVACFVAKHGEPCAERYLDHEAIESAKGAKQYQKAAERLGFPPLPDEEIAKLEGWRAEMITKHGRDFGEDNAWAGPYVHRERPTFADIESAVDFDHMRPFYRLAGHNVHANPKGAQYKIGALEPGKLLIGPSPYGLADPGQNTALALSILVAHLGRICPTMDVLVAAKVAAQLAEEAADQFMEVHEYLEGSLEEESENGEAR